MKLSDHVDHIRELTYRAFDKQFARLGIGASKTMEIEKVPSELHAKRKKLDELLQSHIDEVGNYEDAREKALDELTFTLFNRIAAVKVMEAHNLFAPIITKQGEHGDRSFGHKAWLEENPNMRSEELEGIRQYIKYAFNELGSDIPLYHKDYPYALLPHVIELNEIIEAFNVVVNDTQVEDDIWYSGDILGWLYESYNNAKKQAHKDSGDKTEYDKVSLQSQVYTPIWVVQFLVENSLGKLYLEMFPDSEIKERYKIANAPKERVRDRKPLHEVKLIDPASGSGNFLLYAFDLFYELYIDQIENYGADYEEDDIAQLIIENNLHGIDLDDRAIQLAQLGLYIKAKRKKRTIGNLHFNVISSDFYLPEYEDVKYIFEDDKKLDSQQIRLIENIWGDLKFAYKFGSLIKIEEKIKVQVEALYDKQQREGADLFSSADIQEYKDFEKNFFINLEKAVEKYAKKEGNSFLVGKTQDAITFLKLLSTKYDVAAANPPYTSRKEYGNQLQEFLDSNYREPYDTYINLYACFMQRLHELLLDDGKMAMVTPMTFMFIATFKSTRELILSKYHIDTFVQYGFGGMFAESVDPAFFVLEKGKKENTVSNFIKLDEYFTDNKPDIFIQSFEDLLNNNFNPHNYMINQSELLEIKGHPFIYWISGDFREKFKKDTLNDNVKVCVGLQTGDNNRFLRYWWEINYSKDNDTQWKRYAKGGTFNKWAGNLWLTVNWEDNGLDIKSFKDSKGKLKSRPQNESQYFKKGITYSASGRGGYAFRLLPENNIFDVGGSSIFPIKRYENIEYLLALMNSKLVFYIANCLNPTANIQVGDLQRVPFIEPETKVENKIVALSKQNIEYTQELLTYNVSEYEYLESPFIKYIENNSPLNSIKSFIIEKLFLETLVLINEHLINSEIFNVYSLSTEDIGLVINNQGRDSSTFPASSQAIEAFAKNNKVLTNDEVNSHILNIEKISGDFDSKPIEQSFSKLFNANKSLEDIAIEHELHPIEIWYQYTLLNVAPLKYTKEKAMEFLIDILRELLIEDDDGIIPLVDNASEKILLDRIEEKFNDKGFSSSQFSSFDKVLGKDINDYLNNHFFKESSDYLNMFSYLPKTPFIWHLTSGENQGFDAYIIIYKWSRDNLFRIKSVYIEHRERSLVNRQSDLANDNSASSQNEKDLIYKQLAEIKEFKLKIDELLEEGYNPILDSGVGKNIAPLQKKKMLAYDVLNTGQLKKYLAADW